MDSNELHSSSGMKKSRKKLKKADQALEEEYLENLRDKFQNSLLAERLYYLLVWYDWKAEYHKHRYHSYRTLTSLLLGSITILSVCGFFWTERAISIATVSVSVLITLINQRMEQYRYYENWIRYRGVAEKLKRETHLFLNGCEPYADRERKENERRFAFSMEEFASEENANWKNLYEDSFQKYQHSKKEPPQSSEALP